MTGRKLRTTLVALSTSALMCIAPSTSSACCFTRKAATAYYAPAPAPVCNTCNYVPQVAYRTVYTSVPVTTYRPIVTADPCTGCQSTVMQPVTAYSLQPQLVPYTTYRPVYSNACCAPTTVSYAPACPTGACGAPAAPVASTYYTPAAPAYSVAPVAPAAQAPCCGGATTSAPAMGTSPADVQPSLAPTTSVPATTSNYSVTPSYYGQVKPAQPIKTLPEVNREPAPQRNATIIAPRVNPQDRTTSRPSLGLYRQVTAKLPVTAPTSDDSGWRAAR